MNSFPMNYFVWLYIQVFHKDRIGSAYVLLVVVVTDYLHLVDVKGHFHSLVRGREKTQCVQGKLKLRAHTNKDASFGFNAILPTELESQHVFVFIRLGMRQNVKYVN